MIKVSRLGYAAFEARDPERFAQHHREVLGLTPSAASGSGDVYLTTGNDHHSVAIEAGSQDKILRLGFQLDASLDLGDVTRVLSGHGVDFVTKTDAEPGISSLVEFADPEGNVVHLFNEVAAGPGVTTGSGVKPQKLGHVCLRANDVQALSEWYQGVLGFRWSDWISDFFVFLRCGSDHHSLNLLRGEQPGVMHHMAYELSDPAAVVAACDTLAANGVTLIWGPGRHGPGHNIFTYHFDPAGNVVELFTQLDVMDEANGWFEPRPWHRDVPQRPKRWTRDEEPLGPNQWGIMSPEGFL
jgi:catechol 2,3-dioxygenase-like lactoylglutathione lyase family enzyme/predicted enzyme related to lactoylglutathione lyase